MVLVPPVTPTPPVQPPSMPQPQKPRPTSQPHHIQLSTLLNDIITLSGAAFVSSIILFITLIIWSVILKDTKYYGSLENSVIIYIFLVVFGHLLAFTLAVLIFRNTLVKLGNKTFGILLALLVITQMFWRLLYTGLNYYNCGNKCAEFIVPLKFNHIATGLTGLFLVILAIVFYKLFTRKPRAILPPQQVQPAVKS